MTKNEYFATDYHNFAGWVKMSLEFWAVDFGSFWDIQILHQKLLLIQYLQLLHYITFFDVSPVNHTHLLILWINLKVVRQYRRDLGGKIMHKMLCYHCPHTNRITDIQKNAEPVRSVLADYFYGPGQVPWQWDILFEVWNNKNVFIISKNVMFYDLGLKMQQNIKKKTSAEWCCV